MKKYLKKKINPKKNVKLKFCNDCSERISAVRYYIYIYIYVLKCSRSANKISTYLVVLKLEWSMRKWSWEMGKEDEQRQT